MRLLLLHLANPGSILRPQLWRRPAYNYCYSYMCCDLFGTTAQNKANHAGPFLPKWHDLPSTAFLRLSVIPGRLFSGSFALVMRPVYSQVAAPSFLSIPCAGQRKIKTRPSCVFHISYSLQTSNMLYLFALTLAALPLAFAGVATRDHRPSILTTTTTTITPTVAHIQRDDGKTMAKDYDLILFPEFANSFSRYYHPQAYTTWHGR